MGEIVLGLGVNHTPDFSIPGADAPADEQNRVFQAFSYLRQRLQAASPDLLVVFASEHFANFNYEWMPAYAIGVAPWFPMPMEAWLNIPATRQRGAYEVAEAILRDAMQAEVELTRVGDIPLDHGIATPLHFLGVSPDLPVIPIVVNAILPPLPTLQRCWRLGQVVGESLRQNPRVGRVAVIGSGGLSHHVGTPEMGTVDEAFDRKFLDHITSGAVERILGYSSQEIKAAGNGAEEIRNWVAMAGVLGTYRGKVVEYVPSPAWITGIGFAEFWPTE